MLTRRAALGVAGALSVGSPGQAAPPATVSYDATSDILRTLPFGTHSHWLQPWRAATSTVTAATLARGCGIGLGAVENAMPAGAGAMLAQAGLRLARLELSWGEVDFDTERRFLPADNVRAMLRQCRTNGIRPLMLLNANHGFPAPARRFPVRLAQTALAGAHTLHLASTAGIVPGCSGLSGLTDDGVMASLLVSALDGRTVRLAKRLPVTLDAGQVVEMATLRYAPFDLPGSSGFEVTMAGWLRYVDLVADAAGIGNATDQGFDLEVWNELSFGSAFLSLANYKDRDSTAALDEQPTWDAIVARTAEHVARQPARYAGVALTNGFGSTIPWTASSRQPPRVSAISKHPYPPRKRFPADETAGPDLGPDGVPSRLAPRYNAYFPEYFATAIQTETLWRDIQEAPNLVYDTLHGALARHAVDGTVLPVRVWITELGTAPSELGVTDRGAADRLRAKFCLRSFLFFLGIGVQRLYLFQAFGNGWDFGLVTVGTRPQATLALLAFGRAFTCVTAGGSYAGPVQALHFDLFESDAATEIFSGGEGEPPLRARDCLVFLPFQSSPRRWVVTCYVMTRDIRQDHPPERVRVRLSGLPADSLVARLYDPVADQPSPCEVLDRTRDWIDIQLELTDTPRLLVLSSRT